MKLRGLPRSVAVIAALLVPAIVEAHVVRVEVTRRSVIAGDAWGSRGAYERIEGRVYYAFDPNDPHDRQIVDLNLAPRNARGEVEASSEFVLLRPVNPARSSGVAFVDLVNRGGGAGVIPFSRGRRAAAGIDSAAFYGDGLLLRMGVTVVWLGWQFDIRPPGLGLVAPIAGDTLHPITGLVRDQWVGTVPTRSLRFDSNNQYPVADLNDTAAVLTVRDDPLATPTVIPRTQWSFARDDSIRGPVVDRRAIYLASGFEAGRIYEVVYRAQNPPVAGVGLAAARDFIAYLKHDSSSIAPVRFGIAFGSSQVGRFLREFLHDGFNSDEAGRIAYDGVFAQIAGGGRGSFNQRFAQPGKTSWGFDSFFYPIDVFPFTSVDEVDPLTNVHGALFGDSIPAASMPKIFYVDGGHEYWGRNASLTHTTPDGKRDVALLPNERRYVIGSTSHGGGSGQPPNDASRLSDTPVYWDDPVNASLTDRALVTSLIAWVTRNSAPPPSRYPTIAAGDLVPPDQVRFPAITDVPVARIPGIARRLDFGPRSGAGIFDLQPPRIGAPFATLVPQVDSLGNDRGGIPVVDLAVPLATYFPWRLRTGKAGLQDRISSGSGSMIPLSPTEAARRELGDTRPSIERLYAGKDDFLAKVRAAAARLVADRFLLADDVPLVVEQNSLRWDWVVRR